MVGLKESHKKQINVPEGLFFLAVIGVCLAFSIFEISINVIIDLNGAILGFCFIYLLPALIHIKCSFFPKGKRILKESIKH